MSDVEPVENRDGLKVRLSCVDWKPGVTPGTREHRVVFIGARRAGRRAELRG